MRGRIAFALPRGTFHRQSEITSLDPYMSLVGESPYGAIQEAYLKLEGFVLALNSLSWSGSPKRLVTRSVSNDTQLWYEERPFNRLGANLVDFKIFDPKATPDQGDAYHHYQILFDFPVRSANHSLLLKIRRPFQRLISRVITPVESRDRFQNVKTRGPFNQSLSGLTMLPMASGQRGGGDALRNRGGYGLVLVPLERASDLSFLRVGIFRPNDEYQDSLPCLRRLMKKDTIEIF